MPASMHGNKGIGGGYGGTVAITIAARITLPVPGDCRCCLRAATRVSGFGISTPNMSRVSRPDISFQPEHRKPDSGSTTVDK